jgi:ligand-binding sensor domain-containing protein/serine phosphatase RsbU (regulator of sigma subunit)
MRNPFQLRSIRKSCGAFLLLCFFAPNFIFAQELRFTHISTENGLSQISAQCVFEDSKGFIWIGTQDGLNRYDGYGISIFKHNPVDNNSLSNNFVSDVMEDRDGLLWFATSGGGLDSYEPATRRFTHHMADSAGKNSISSDIIWKLYQDKKGLIWICTEDGLNTYDKKSGKFSVFRHDQDLPSTISCNAVYDIVEDKDGNFWIATMGGGLNCLNSASGKFKSFGLEAEDIPRLFSSKMQPETQVLTLRKSKEVRCLSLDREGRLWVGTDGAGLGLFDIPSRSFKKYYTHHEKDPASVGDKRIFDVGEDVYGNIWVGNYGKGISILNPRTGKFSHNVNDEKNTLSLNANDIRCVYFDPENNAWIGTGSGGMNVCYKSMGKFTHYKKIDNPQAPSNSLGNDIVLSLMEDRENKLWIGTYGGGLSVLDRGNGNYTQFKKLSIASNDAVTSLLEDTDGDIVVGTCGGGLVVYNKKTEKQKNYTPESGVMSDGTIMCLMQDKQGIIWFGTFEGMYSFDKRTETFRKYTINNGMSSNIIYSLFQDSRGMIWIGTKGGGAMMMNPSDGKFNSYKMDKAKPGISANTVNCFYEDSEGHIWMGTSNGLDCYDRKNGKFTNFYEKNGLQNDFIYSILPDKSGKLWMSTNKGVSRYDPFSTKQESSAFRNYGVNDGLQRGEFNQNAFFKNKKGELFFGGVDGFNVFTPENIKDNPHIPPVYLVSYQRYGKDVGLDTSITYKSGLDLDWRDNNFTFEFVALDYVMPLKNKFKYFLEGFDEDWSPASTQRFVSYTNIPGGDYNLHVKASNDDEVWNEKGAVLHIHIRPPFWKTAWFYVLVVFVSIGAVLGFISYRTASVKKENKLLEAKVAVRTNELAQVNKDITSSIQYAKRIQEAILPERSAISTAFLQSFILYQPKDIVSGDFYWFGEKDGKRIIAVVDCTGHGVPGAFMSMIGNNLLSQIVLEKGITEPARILDALHKGITTALKQQGTQENETSDGMDVAICSIDSTTNALQYAGAFRPLFIVKNDAFVTELSLEKISPDKFPIGGTQMSKDRKFTNHDYAPAKGDTVYMFSDGYADQFGGEHGKKFMMKRFSDMLISFNGLSMNEQCVYLENAIGKWKGRREQVDDILVIGIRL